ncbi:acyltransferase family protein [Streptomyces yunnanensis]|uniref:Peptidoglycan/LPS O-acetylase OafA/YrhL, contains acyltransferase and SGNH-hydrolase domains n=1 Tax=Streptomyces yunnanensis TaxID=156453 RepID=A0A9X8QYC3_9ACTN|nr:acyltransferase [Streptomyces yunnanensis]SHN04892.1 Peptidoglycan/LPS O-acetylase OafA/YrhL, contains acyltransferase and SGNH-hydrolase domains [Streptomyces yunnanensis]
MAERRIGNRLAVLDGLRLLAALMVVFYHYVALARPWGHSTDAIFPTAHRLAQYGWLGVEVFFLISGFVICMSVWGRTVGEFAVSRLTRLFPAYWVGILLTVLVVKMWPEVASLRGWDTVITNLTMLQGGNNTPNVDPVYWTLFVELKFYLIMVVVVLFGVTYRNCLILCGVWTAAAALAPVMNTPLLTAFAMPQYAPFFIAGIAFYLMRRFRPNAILWAIVILQLLLAQRYIDYRLATNLGKAAVDALPTWPARFLIIAAFAVVGAIALGAFDRIQWKWLTTAGALTYPLYVIHMNIGMTLIHHYRNRIPAPVLVASVVALMLVAAWLIHRFVERPLGKWLRTTMRRGIDDVRRNVAPRRRHARPATTPPPPPPVVAHAAQDERTPEHARAADSA